MGVMVKIDPSEMIDGIEDYESEGVSDIDEDMSGNGENGRFITILYNSRQDFILL